MRLRIDYRKCARSGQCFYMYPDLVEKGADNLPRLLSQTIASDKTERAEELIDICPMEAIQGKND